MRHLAGYIIVWMICALLCSAPAVLRAADKGVYARARTALMAEIEADVRETADYLGRAAPQCSSAVRMYLRRRF